MQDVRKKWGEMENHWPVKLQWHRFVITGTINNRFSTTLFFSKLVLTIPTFLQSPFFYYWSRRSALSLCKEKWILEREVMVHIVMAAQWTITNLQVMPPTRSLTYARIAAELELWTKPCHSLNLNESKSMPFYSKADRFCTLFHL